MTYALWLAEFILEVSGAILSYRKRLSILFALLAWRAFMDLVTAAFFFTPLHFHYAAVMWAGRAAQYAILYSLGVQIAAKMVNEWRPIWQYVYKTVAIVASVATYIFVVTELWEHKFLHAEAVTCFLLLAVVLLGWIDRKGRLEEPWNLISLSLVIYCVGNSICAILSSKSQAALAWYPLPAIVALILWNVSAWKPHGRLLNFAALRNQRKLREFKVSCGHGVQRDAATGRNEDLLRARNETPAGITRKPVSGTWVEPSRLKVN